MKKRKELLVALMIASCVLAGCNSQTTVDGTDTEANVNVTVEEQNDDQENALDYREYIGKTLGELTDSEKAILMDGRLNINNFDGSCMVNAEGIVYGAGSLELPEEERTVNLQESLVVPYGFACVALNEVQLLVFNDSMETVSLNDGRIVGYCIFDVDATTMIDTTGEEWLYYDKPNNHMYLRVVGDIEVELAAQTYYYYGFPFPNAVNDYREDLEILDMWTKIEAVMGTKFTNSYPDNAGEIVTNEAKLGIDTIQITSNTDADKFVCQVELLDNIKYNGETVTAGSAQSSAIILAGIDNNGKWDSDLIYAFLYENQYSMTEEEFLYLIDVNEDTSYVEIRNNENYSFYIRNHYEDITQNYAVHGFFFDKTTGLTYYIYVDKKAMSVVNGGSEVITIEGLETFGEEFFSYVSTHISLKQS